MPFTFVRNNDMPPYAHYVRFGDNYKELLLTLNILRNINPYIAVYFYFSSALGTISLILD